MFTKWLNMGLPLGARIEKIIHGIEIHEYFGKEKVPGTPVSKEGYAESYLGYERNHHNQFSWKRSNSKQCFLLPIPRQSSSYSMNETPIQSIDQVGRVFANGMEDQVSIPGRVIPKTQKMVFDNSLLNTKYF